MPKLTPAQIDIATELGPDGFPIGRDPRCMTPDELRKIGQSRSRHSGPFGNIASIVVLVRRRGSAMHVAFVPGLGIRMGTNPWRQPASAAQRAQGRKLGAKMRQKSPEALPLNGSENGAVAAGTGVGVRQRRDKTVSREIRGALADDDGPQE